MLQKIFNRDSWVWLMVFIGAFAAYIDGTPPFGEWSRHEYIQLALFLAAWFSGKAATSPFSGGSSATLNVDTKRFLVGLLVPLLLLGAACGKTLNFQTNPVGTTAHYAEQVTRAVHGIQDAVIGAEKSRLMTADQTAKVVRVTVQLGQKAQELATALSELDKLPLTDIGRAPLVAKVGLIVQTINELVYDLNLSDYFSTLTPETKQKIYDLLREVGRVLVTLATEVR